MLSFSNDFTTVEKEIIVDAMHPNLIKVHLNIPHLSRRHSYIHYSANFP